MNTIKFKSYRAIPLSKTPAKVLIKWELEQGTTDLQDYEFYVERGAAEDNRPGVQNVDIYRRPVTPEIAATVANNIQPLHRDGISALDFHWYVDYSDSLKNLNNTPYYRIRCRKISTQEDVVTPSFTWAGELDMVGLYIVDEHNFLLSDVTGVPVLVYNRRRGGVACPSCFDPIQKKRTSSSCNVCYGTNWVGGFYKPIDTYIDFTPNPKASTIQQWGEVQPNETNALASNFPTLVPGDLIRELHVDRLWRVVQATETEKRRVPMLQFLRVTEIKPGDIEYKIQFDERFAITKVAELEATKLKREF